MLLTAIRLMGIVQTFPLHHQKVKQTVEPKLPKRKTKRYLTEVTTYITNQAKWKAAREWCADHGLEFIILTEDHLNV